MRVAVQASADAYVAKCEAEDWKYDAIAGDIEPVRRLTKEFAKSYPQCLVVPCGRPAAVAAYAVVGEHNRRCRPKPSLEGLNLWAKESLA